MKGPDYDAGMAIIRAREQAASARQDIDLLNSGRQDMERFGHVRRILRYRPAARYVYGESGSLVADALDRAMEGTSSSSRYPHLEALEADRLRRGF